MNPQDDWQDFELGAVDISEAEATVFGRQVIYALRAATLDELIKAKTLGRVEHDGKQFTATGYLAHLWKCSKQRVNTLADIGEKIDPEHWYPDKPLGLFKAAVEADGANGLDADSWLVKAVEEGWNSRQLRDAADIKRGKRVSRVKFSGRCPVRQWDVNTDTLTVTGLGISGEAPAEAEVTVREVLRDG